MIECALCGAQFSYELSRCPKCGASVYPEEELAPREWKVAEEGPRGILSQGLNTLSALGAGWFTAAVVSIFIFFMGRLLFLAMSKQWAVYIGSGISVSAGALVGGWIAGRFTHARKRLHGLVVGLLCVVISVFLTGSELGADLQRIFVPASWLGWLVILLAGWAGAEIALRMLHPGWEANCTRAVSEEEAAYRDLLDRVRYDRGLAERLIEYEAGQRPLGTRVELIQSAIRRWDRDNRA